ncbi:MAG: hypothetical protein ACFCAD_12340 [Pleurocapsa sp.]
MSFTARWILGIASLFFASMFIPTILDNPSNPLFWLVAIFIVLIAIACLIPRLRNISLRLIGGTIFGSYAVSFIASFPTDNLFKAIVVFIIWALPGLYLAIYGTYPDWAIYSQVFNANKSKK